MFALNMSALNKTGSAGVTDRMRETIQLLRFAPCRKQTPSGNFSMLTLLETGMFSVLFNMGRTHMSVISTRYSIPSHRQHFSTVMQLSVNL